MLTRLLRNKGSFGSDAAISMAAGVAARAITLASLPSIAHFYAPAELGLWTIILSLTQYFSPFATLRYDIAVVIAPTERMSRSLTMALLRWLLVVALLLAAFVFLASAEVLAVISGLGASEQGVLRLTPVLLVLLGAQLTLQSYLTRRRKFLALGLAQILQAVTTPVAQLGLLWSLPASGWTAAEGALLGFIVAVAIMAASAGPELSSRGNRGWAQVARQTARRYKAYPLYMLPYSLSSGLSERILQVLLINFYSLGTLGAFALARQIVNAPAVLMSSSLRQVMFGHSAAQTDPEARRARTLAVLRLMIDVSAPATGFALIWLPSVLLYAMPPAWSEMTSYAWWCLFPTSMLFLCSWLDRMFDVLGKPRLSVTLQIVSDFVVVAVVLIGGRLGLEASRLISCVTMTQTAYYVIWLTILLRQLDVRWTSIMTIAARLAAELVVWTVAHSMVMRTFSIQAGFLVSVALLVATIATVSIRLLRRQSQR